MITEIGGFNFREMLHDAGGVDALNLDSELHIGNADPGIFSTLIREGIQDSLVQCLYRLMMTPLSISSRILLSVITHKLNHFVRTDGHDVIDATVEWAADINANDGDDIITTVGYGSDG